MKLEASMTDAEFDLIEKHIDCDQWANPMEGEFIFYNPTERFRLILALYDIVSWTDQEEENK